jgi:hypothetical protein
MYVDVSLLWVMCWGVRHSMSCELTKSFGILPAGEFHMHLTWTAVLRSSISHLTHLSHPIIHFFVLVVFASMDTLSTVICLLLPVTCEKLWSTQNSRHIFPCLLHYLHHPWICIKSCEPMNCRMKGVDSDNVLNCHSFDLRYYLLVILETEMVDDTSVELKCGTRVW